MDALIIILAFQEPGRRPVSIGSVDDDPELLHLVARAALRRAEGRVAELVHSNPTMAKLQAAELDRLRTSLDILVPGFDSQRATRVI
jgi:hypothetical protein